VIGHEPADIRLVEVSAARRLAAQQHVADQLAQVLAEPLRDGHLESLLGPVQHLVGDDAAHRGPERDLLLVAADLQLRRQRGGELHQPVIEQRRAGLQPVGHRGHVHLHEQVARQVGAHVHLEHALEQRVARGLLPGVGHEAGGDRLPDPL